MSGQGPSFRHPTERETFLRNAPLKEAWDWVQGLLDEQAATPAPNEPAVYEPELLWTVGKSVAHSHPGVDEKVLEWYRQRPTSKRIEVAACFFAGYWQVVDEVHAPAARLLLSVLDRIDEVPERLDSFFYGSLLLALSKIAKRDRELVPGVAPETIHEIILQHLNRLQARQELPQVQSMFKTWLQPRN